jgi:predicted kinase
MLIIVCGLPGSGKTTLADALTKRFSAVHISSDITRKRMFERPAYSGEEKASVYARMAAEAESALGEGKDVVVDATFYREGERERFRKLAESAGTGSFIVMCVLNERKTKARLERRRRGGPSDADFGVYLKLKGAFEPIKARHLVTDTSLPLMKQMRMVEEYVGR